MSKFVSKSTLQFVINYDRRCCKKIIKLQLNCGFSNIFAFTDDRFSYHLTLDDIYRNSKWVDDIG